MDFRINENFNLLHDKSWNQFTTWSKFAYSPWSNQMIHQNRKNVFDFDLLIITSFYDQNNCDIFKNITVFDNLKNIYMWVNSQTVDTVNLNMY